MCNCKCLKAGARIRVPGLVDDRIFLFRLKDGVVAYATIDAWDRSEYMHPSYTNDWYIVEPSIKLSNKAFVQPK